MGEMASTLAGPASLLDADPTRGVSASRHPRLTRSFGFLSAVVEGIAIVAVLVDLVVTFTNSVGRYGFGAGLEWAEDISGIAMPIITFLGSAAYYRRGHGMAYTALIDQSPGPIRDALLATGTWLVIAVSAAILYATPDFLEGQALQSMPVLGISQVVSSIWLGIGLVLFVVFAIEKLLLISWPGIAAGLGATLVLLVFLVFLRGLEAEGRLAVDPLAALLVILVVAFLCAVPIALVLAIGGVAFLIISDAAPLVAAPATFQSGVSSFLLVAVPFFLIAGVLMEITGMARRLIDMIQEWVGHWRGGLLLAEVVSMYAFSGMSGSKAADVATVGSVMKEPLRERGYPPSESVAVLAASAAMGEVIPPSIALLILGSVSSLSIGTLFIAGLVPAALLAVALMGGILLRARWYGFPSGPPFRLKRALLGIPPAIPALLVPVIVLGGIIGGVASPTEASSFAVVYALLAATIIYRSLSLRTLWTGIREATVTAGMVLFMMSAATLFSQAIVIDGLGMKLGALLAGLTDPRAFLFVSMAVIIVLGFILEGFPAILITAPLLLPIAVSHGVDPLQFGILLTMAVGIGVFMPPVGIGYYIACAVGGAPPNATIMPTLFYNVFLIFGLVIAILFPQIIVGLPQLLGL